MFLGYNYRIMKKWLFIVGAPAVVLAVIGMSIFDQIHYAQKKGYTVNCTHPSEPSVAADSLICVTDSHQEYDGGKPYPPPWNMFLAWPEGITALLLLLTLGSVTWQGWQTRDAAKATKEAVVTANKSFVLQETTAKQQLRAYMCVSQARLNFRDDSQIKAQIEMENTGQTPAYEVRTWVDSMVREHPLLSPFEPPPANLAQSDGIIGSGRHHVSVTNPLYGKEIDFGRVWYPGHAFYVYGECSYRDIFKKRHVLSFRMIFGGPGQINIKDDSDGIRFGLLSMDIAGNEERDED
jgi:hypothetical protein